MQLIEGTVFCLLAASLWTGISAAEPLPEESMNVVSLEFIAMAAMMVLNVLNGIYDLAEVLIIDEMNSLCSPCYYCV